MAISPERIRSALEAAISPLTQLEVIDDSDAHAGHAGAGEGSHWTVRLRSPAFAGQSRVARHRLVYDALRPLIDEGIHALRIDARTPDEP